MRNYWNTVFDELTATTETIKQNIEKADILTAEIYSGKYSNELCREKQIEIGKIKDNTEKTRDLSYRNLEIATNKQIDRLYAFLDINPSEVDTKTVEVVKYGVLSDKELQRLYTRANSSTQRVIARLTADKNLFKTDRQSAIILPLITEISAVPFTIDTYFYKGFSNGLYYYKSKEFGHENEYITNPNWQKLIEMLERQRNNEVATLDEYIEEFGDNAVETA